MPKACDACQSSSALIFCRADSAFLCLGCDNKVHGANKLASRHERVWMCEVCEMSPAVVTCKADAAALCMSCDTDIHSANPLARRHERVPVTPFYECPAMVRVAHIQSMVPGGPVLQKPKSLIEDDLPLADEEEAEAASWLLPGPLHPSSRLGADTLADFSHDSHFANPDGFGMDPLAPCSTLKDVKSHTLQSLPGLPLPVQDELHFNNKLSQLGSQIHPPSKQVVTGMLNPKHPGIYSEIEPFLEMDFGGVAQRPQLSSIIRSASIAPDSLVPVHSPEELLRRSPSMSMRSSIESPSLTMGLHSAYGSVHTKPHRMVSGESCVVPDSSDGSTAFEGFNSSCFEMPPRVLHVGQEQPMAREARVQRYKEKRLRRKFEKTIRYASRKAYAESRPRVKGRFAKRSDGSSPEDSEISYQPSNSSQNAAVGANQGLTDWTVAL